MFSESLKQGLGVLRMNRKSSSITNDLLSLEPGCCYEDRTCTSSGNFGRSPCGATCLDINEVNMVYIQLEGGMFGQSNECDEYLKEYNQQQQQARSTSDSSTASSTAMMDVDEYLWSSN